jgi:hypothetical protein
MNAFEYFQKYGRMPQGSTIATRRATAQDIAAARADKGVDFHVEQRTDAQ